MKRINMTYLRNTANRMMVVMTLMAAIWGCQQEALEPEKVSSNKLEEFLNINEELYKELCNNPEFVSATEEYISSRNRIRKNRVENYQEVLKAVARLETMSTSLKCRNLLAYSFRYEKDRMSLSRVAHEWGSCSIYSTDPCNTYQNWLAGWDCYHRIENGEIINIEPLYRAIFRTNMYEYLNTCGHYGTAQYFSQYVMNLSPYETFDSYRDLGVRNERLSDMVQVYGLYTICSETYNMEHIFDDYVMMCQWFDGEFAPLPSGITLNPEDQENNNEALSITIAQWSGEGHEFILMQAIQDLGLPSECLTILVDASKWCDDFFEGNQFSEAALLHAMRRGQDSLPYREKEYFKKHLRKYLNLSLETDPLWNMGVALHGITDSFCPSHTGFQFFEWDNIDAIVNHRKWDNWKNSPERTRKTIDIVKRVLDIAYGEEDYLRQGGRVEAIIKLWEMEYNKL